MKAAVRVKICGLTNPDDAAAAIAAGADALGFNFYPGSKRYLDRVSASAWLAEIPATVNRIAVLVNPTLEEAFAVSELPFIDGLQLHGVEAPAFCAALVSAGVRFGKALPVSEAGALPDPTSFSSRTIVLDTQSEIGFGGSGRTFPWWIARDLIARHCGLRFVLAGGLTPENVADAISQVRPFAVDVTTGVETSPGRKDLVRLRAFIAAAKAA